MLDTLQSNDPYMAAEQQQWDAQTEAYDAKRAEDQIYSACVDSAVANLEARDGDFVLDAACGTGLTVRKYVRPGVRTVALDLSVQSLLHLRGKLPAYAQVDLICGDLTAIPLASGLFTKVLCANAIQQLPEAEARSRSVGELARVGAPGARVVVTVHNFSRLKEKGGWKKQGSTGGSSGEVQWIYRFSTNEFESMLATSLRVRKVAGAGLPLWYRFKLAPVMKLIERLGWNFRLSTRWSHMLLGVATTG
jgi:ubiquinone/menaquinone biosynthesis C-methylase UbiE